MFRSRTWPAGRSPDCSRHRSFEKAVFPRLPLNSCFSHSGPARNPLPHRLQHRVLQAAVADHVLRRSGAAPGPGSGRCAPPGSCRPSQVMVIWSRARPGLPQGKRPRSTLAGSVSGRSMLGEDLRDRDAGHRPARAVGNSRPPTGPNSGHAFSTGRRPGPRPPMMSAIAAVSPRVGSRSPVRQ